MSHSNETKHYVAASYSFHNFRYRLRIENSGTQIANNNAPKRSGGTCNVRQKGKLLYFNCYTHYHRFGIDTDPINAQQSCGGW